MFVSRCLQLDPHTPTVRKLHSSLKRDQSPLLSPLIEFHELIIALRPVSSNYGTCLRALYRQQFPVPRPCSTQIAFNIDIHIWNRPFIQLYDLSAHIPNLTQSRSSKLFFFISILQFAWGPGYCLLFERAESNNAVVTACPLLAYRIRPADWISKVPRERAFFTF